MESPEDQELKVREITIDNIHNTLKTLWQIGMLGAFFNITKEYGLSFGKCENITDFFNIIFSLKSITFIAFLFLFLRLFVGDSRMLDLSYKESIARNGIRKTLEKFGPRKVSTDLVLLTSHAILFHLMAANLNTPKVMLYFANILLFVNSVWLILVFWHKDGFGQKDELTGMLKNTPLVIWSLNNFIFFMFYIILRICEKEYHWYSPYISIWIGMILLLLNSLFDSATTWNYYFPKVNDTSTLPIGSSTPSTITKTPAKTTARPKGEQD